MKLDRTRSFARIVGELYTPADCDRPAHFQQDHRFFDSQDCEIVSGRPLTKNVPNSSPVRESSVLRPEEKSAIAKERESLLKIVIGMAIVGYTWNPSRARNEATRDIVNDILALGLSIDDDTVRKFLRQAAELLPTQPIDSEKE